jgi:hypothetical protein
MDKYQRSQKDKIFKEKSHDPYRMEHVRGAALCPQCGALYQEGNWTWHIPESTVAANAEETVCPACRRIADDRPAGTLTLSGKFLHDNQQEIINLIHHTEGVEKAEHAQERIIKVVEVNDGLEVTTTGIHLASRIGHALNAAYKGNSHYHYSDDENHINVSWERS